jgi:hypothetical protein
MNGNFNGFEWHDSVLADIYIDRRNPGKCDEVILNIVWRNQNKNKLVFYDCYKMDAHFNFGIVGPEQILGGQCVEKSTQIDEIIKLWQKMGGSIGDLKQYELETNSTHSNIVIWALGFRMEEVESV